MARNGFGVLCLLGAIAVATVALLEIARARRGDSLLTRGQFRLRLLSALIWIVILGSLCYAVLFLWPRSGDLAGARRFISLVSGAILLLIIALLLLAYDMWQLSLQRRVQEANFQRQLEQTAREELQRAQQRSQPGSRQSQAEEEHAP